MHRILKRTGIIALMLAAAPALSSAQSAEKVAELAERDPYGLIMSITAICVVFAVLIALYIAYKYVGKGFNGDFRKRQAAPAGKKDMTPEVALAIAMALDKETSGEMQAAISLALHQYMNDTVHDNESFVITIRQTPSQWNAKTLMLRQLPK